MKDENTERSREDDKALKLNLFKDLSNFTNGDSLFKKNSVFVTSPINSLRKRFDLSASATPMNDGKKFS